MSDIDPRLSAFLTRCERVGETLRITRSTLSTKLFTDGKRLDEIASGSSDIGIGRLARAERALAALEAAPRPRRATRPPEGGPAEEAA